MFIPNCDKTPSFGDYNVLKKKKWFTYQLFFLQLKFARNNISSERRNASKCVANEMPWIFWAILGPAFSSSCTARFRIGKDSVSFFYGNTIKYFVLFLNAITIACYIVRHMLMQFIRWKSLNLSKMMFLIRINN